MTAQRKRIAMAVGLVLAVASAFVAGWWPRQRAQQRAVQLSSAQLAPPRVAVVTATALGTGRELTLPGGLVAIQQTLVYARANGYVRRWRVDIGDRVRRGQVLADLDTPELDQQLAQARSLLVQRKAALDQAEANRALARLTATRQDALAARKLVAQQDADTANAQAAIAEGSVASAQADVHAQEQAVRQFEDLVSFATVRAPFDGTVTKRLIEVGSLVNAGAAAATQALFELEATDPLRVFIQVPQVFAPKLNVGTGAVIAVRQYTDRKFDGKLTRTAGALDPTTRTLVAEVLVPNAAGDLLPGMYCEVTLPVTLAHRIVRVPASAVLFDARGVHVASVGDDNRVHLVAVQVGRNLGDDIELVEGLVGGERILATPPANLADGMLVTPVPR